MCRDCVLKFALYTVSCKLFTMTLDTLIMSSGALVAILPFLGFPNSWDRIIFAIVGVIVIALGVVVRRRVPIPQKKISTYVESGTTSHDSHEAL